MTFSDTETETIDDDDAVAEPSAPSTTTADVIPKEVLDEAVRQAYIDHEYTRKNRAGEVLPDEGAVKARVYEVIRERIVSARAEMADQRHSVTTGELYAAVFPNGPGADRKQNLADLSDLDRAVRAKLSRKVWSLTNPNRQGYVQGRLGKEGRSEILVRTPVQRGVDELPGVFLTNDADLIMNESVKPVVEKLLSAARELRLHDEVVIGPRHPELAGTVTKAFDVAKKRVIAELTRSNGSPAALPAGSQGNVTD